MGCVMTVAQLIKHLERMPGNARVIYQTAHPDQRCDVKRVCQKHAALGVGPIMDEYVFIELTKPKMESL